MQKIRYNCFNIDYRHGYYTLSSNTKFSKEELKIFKKQNLLYRENHAPYSKSTTMEISINMCGILYMFYTISQYGSPTDNCGFAQYVNNSAKQAREGLMIDDRYKDILIRDCPQEYKMLFLRLSGV